MLKRLGKLKSLLKYGVTAILLAIPLYPKFPFVDVPGTFVSIRLEDFLVFVIFLIWLITILPDWRSLFKNKVNVAILVYMFVGFVSVVSAVFLTKTVSLHIGVLHWVRRFEYFAAFFIGASVIKSQRDLAFFSKLLVIVAIWAFAYGMGQKYLSWPIVTTQNAEYSKGVALRYLPGGHIPATFAGHYDLASYLVLATPVLFSMFFVSNKKEKIVYLFGIGASYWLMINAVSRISIVSFMGAITLALLLIRKYKAIPIFIVASVLLMATSSSLITRYMRVFQYLLTSITPTVQAAELSIGSVLGVEDRSTSIRLNVEWPRALRAFAKNPLLGTGYSSITLATDNDYLRLLGETGLVGFVAFALILIRVAIRFLKTIPLPKLDVRSAYLAGIIGAFPGILLNATFIDVFEASKFAILFWLFMGFGYAVTRWPSRAMSRDEKN